jgi:hypothetical protein
MPSANLYKAITKADEKNTGAGYKNVVLWAPVSTFLSIKTPTLTPAVLGDKVKITTAHTFNTDEGFISWKCKTNSVTLTTESVGDDGAKSLLHKARFVLLGDSASTQEQLQDFLNDQCLFLLKDSDCLNTTDYIQLGDECTQPIATVNFDGKLSGVNETGLKEYTVEIATKSKKFWYSSTVTLKP